MTFLAFSPLEQFEYLTIATLGNGINVNFADLILNEALIKSLNFGHTLSPTLYDLFLETYVEYLNNIPAVVVEGIYIQDTDWVLQQFFIFDHFYSNIARNFWGVCTLLTLGVPAELHYANIVEKNPIFALIVKEMSNEFFYCCQLQHPTLDMGFINIPIKGEDGEIILNPATTEQVIAMNGEYIETYYWLNIYNSFVIVLILFAFSFILGNILLTQVNFFNIWTFTVDLLISFLYETYGSLVDKRLLKYFPLFFTLFIFVFLSNLTALVPFSFCLTSNLWFTLTLSLFVWVGVTVLAIVVRGKDFFIAFVPANVPSMLKPFLTIIEIISYIARAISLGVRIFANMLAGHSLVHILSDLVENCISASNTVGYKVFAIFPAIILTFIIFIEFGICFLQALVFVILTAIYLNEAFGFNAH